MEHNDPRWPPTNWFIAAEDRFEPPDIWEPKLNRPPVPLSGEGFVIGVPPGSPDAEALAGRLDDPGPTHRRRMTTLWARESLRSGQRYYRIARLCAWTDWAIDRAEDWSPDEKDLRNELANWWVSGQQAVSAYFHFQAWRSRIEPRPVDSTLRQLRNSLIHLDEAELGQYGARSLYDEKGRPSKAWAIDKLPDGTLPLVFHASSVESVFGLIDLRSMYDEVAPYQTFPTGDPWDEPD